MRLLASAGGMSEGGSTTRLTSSAASAAPTARLTARRLPSRSSCCNTTLWIEYQNGIATLLPPSWRTSAISGATVSPEPPTWFQATTLAGTLLP